MSVTDMLITTKQTTDVGEVFAHLTGMYIQPFLCKYSWRPGYWSHYSNSSTHSLISHHTQPQYMYTKHHSFFNFLTELAIVLPPPPPPHPQSKNRICPSSYTDSAPGIASTIGLNINTNINVILVPQGSSGGGGVGIKTESHFEGIISGSDLSPKLQWRQRNSINYPHRLTSLLWVVSHGTYLII